MPSPLRLVTHRAPLPGLRLRYWRYDGDVGMIASPGAHPGLELSFVEDGEMTIRVGARTLTAGPGDLVLVPAGAEHVTGVAPAMRGGAIELDDGRVQAIARACGGIGEPAVLRDECLLPLVRLFVDEAGRDDPSGRLAADALADAIAVRALRARAPELRRAPPDPRIQTAIEFIHAHYAEEITIEGLARVAGMSRYHFSRCFRAAMGSTPYQYVQDTRLAATEAMLRTGCRSVTEVALSCGFNDLSRFARAFRQRTGCRPSDYGRDIAARTAWRSAASTSRSASGS